MDFFTCLGYLFEVLIALAVLIVIAEPERVFKAKMSKSKTVGPSYWGNYHYSKDHPEAESAQIEVTIHPRKDKVHAGGKAYSSGRGV